MSKNTTPEDWRLREASTFAFGLVLDGPNPAVLLETVKQALAFLLQVKGKGEARPSLGMNFALN